MNDAPLSTGTKRRRWVKSIAVMALIFGALGGYLFWRSVAGVVSIDTSRLDAPIAAVAPTTAGVLNMLYVQEGDRVAANAPIAVVGSETLYAKESGIVDSAPRVVGSYFGLGQPVVQIVVDEKMRVVGEIEETKGLDEIAPGKPVTFTVDAFPGRTYVGVVDEIAPASNDAAVAFSISDKRPVKKFDVYMRFPVKDYPELKTGMSAKVKVYVN
ncbi:MAG TPA: efflux RND transporter periplasmic adaptor subunit [Candidatus Paceibacterota bacterium]|nr:efflux RND transporter periplasmic adaptor subunit [Candidatus Paceibacterota bacterium]